MDPRKYGHQNIYGVNNHLDMLKAHTKWLCSLWYIFKMRKKQNNKLTYKISSFFNHMTDKESQGNP